MKPRICVSILPKTVSESLRLTEQAEDKHADLVEIRLDYFKNSSRIADLAAHGKTPKIATCKPVNCQGKFTGVKTEQHQLLRSAAENGFDYVDVDLNDTKIESIVRELKHLGAKPIVSFHDFSKTPGTLELGRILEREIANGAEVCKIITTARNMEDNLAILNFASSARKKARTVCFAMGETGKVSRLLSPLFGSDFTFASLARGNETAAGQLTIQEMKTAYELLGHRK